MLDFSPLRGALGHVQLDRPVKSVTVSMDNVVVFDHIVFACFRTLENSVIASNTTHLELFFRFYGLLLTTYIGWGR